MWPEGSEDRNLRFWPFWLFWLLGFWNSEISWKFSIVTFWLWGVICEGSATEVQRSNFRFWIWPFFDIFDWWFWTDDLDDLLDQILVILILVDLGPGWVRKGLRWARGTRAEAAQMAWQGGLGRARTEVGRALGRFWPFGPRGQKFEGPRQNLGLRVKIWGFEEGLGFWSQGHKIWGAKKLRSGVNFGHFGSFLGTPP